jgi:hypothetical protein
MLKNRITPIATTGITSQKELSPGTKRTRKKHIAEENNTVKFTT